VTSDEGLNVYGASTWGQFFVYQGFNAHAGWMHTSSGVDSVDEFAEKIDRKRGSAPCYRYGAQCRPLAVRPVTIRYRTADGHLSSKTFRTWRTHHGPIVRAANGRWIAFAMMDKPVEALQQSFGRTKAKDLNSFLKIANLKANSSNDTIFADSKGEVAYLHPQFVPRRDNRFDYEKPVDGSDPASDWRGLHALSELPSVIRPATGWIVNTNNWPYSASGADSPDPKRFPKYMDTVGENFRGVHAKEMLDPPKLYFSYLAADQERYAAIFPDLLKSIGDQYRHIFPSQFCCRIHNSRSLKVSFLHRNAVAMDQRDPLLDGRGGPAVEGRARRRDGRGTILRRRLGPGPDRLARGRIVGMELVAHVRLPSRSASRCRSRPCAPAQCPPPRATG